MLTPRENLQKMLDGEQTERLVNGYEPFDFVLTDPLIAKYYLNCYIEGQDTLDPWGVTIRWKKGEHAGMPYVTEENKLIKDVTEWKEHFVKQNDVFPEEAWEAAKKQVAGMDRKNHFVTGIMVSGVFEKLHSFMGFEDTLMNFYLEPEAMHELIDAVFEWKMAYAKEMIDHLDLDFMLYHDDLGAKDRPFFSNEIFEEFFKEGYEKLFGYMHERGVKILFHSDSYCETLVEDFVDCHIDIWQGALCTNNFETIQNKVHGKLICMGGVDSIIDRADWTQEEVDKEVLRAIEAGVPYGAFIPCITYGLKESIFPGVIEATMDAVERYNKEHFKY